MRIGFRPHVAGGATGGAPLNDPLTLNKLFPGLGVGGANGTSGVSNTIVSIADNILDLTGPASSLTAEMTSDHVNWLLSQIQSTDPSYRFESLGFPQTVAGQANLIAKLRVDRAAALYRVRGELRPLQVETIRFMKQRTDRAYDNAIAAEAAGQLKVRLSRNEAIGNFVDREVRREVRKFYYGLGIDLSGRVQVRVVGREYDTSPSEQSFRVPDVRVGSVAFDVTLTRKTSATPQVRGFFTTDFRPDTVVIVRPSQLVTDTLYAIPRQSK